MQIFVSGLVGRPTLCLNFSDNEVLVSEIKSRIACVEGIPVCEQRLSTGCRDLRDSEPLAADGDVFIRFNLRLLGGKGGFGALLRGQGGGHKTTNFDDCRDLNGRRLRHLKNEMKLAEWYAEQKALELEKKNKKRDREPPKHEWDSSKFMETTKELQSSVASSVEAGFLQAKKKKKAGDRKASPAEQEPVKAIHLLGELDDILVDGGAPTPDAAASASAAQSPNGTQNGSERASKPDGADDDDSSSDSDSDSSSSDDEDDGDTLLNLDLFGSADELEALGLEDLKLQLQARGLKCGGSLKERAVRLFSVKGKTPDQYDPKIRAPPAKQ